MLKEFQTDQLNIILSEKSGEAQDISTSRKKQNRILEHEAMILLDKIHNSYFVTQYNTVAQYTMSVTLSFFTCHS